MDSISFWINYTGVDEEVDGVWMLAVLCRRRDDKLYFTCCVLSMLTFQKG